MLTVPVLVDSHLRCDGNFLGNDLAEEIFDELEIFNVERAHAERTKRWGWWDIPEYFQLGELDGDTVVMPRGYALQLKLLLRERNKRVMWVDKRKWAVGKPFTWRKEPDPLYSHQPLAVKRMIKHQQGIYEAPTGSGKTMTCVRFIHDVHPQSTIILVDKIELLNQWIKYFQDWFGIKAAQIGGRKWEEGRITVATVQTLWSQIRQFEGATDEQKQALDDWFAQWTCTFVDECHHVSAETIENMVSRFSSLYRIGVSATPDRMDSKFEITQAILGEVFHQDDEEKLRQLGIIVKPTVKVVRTGFKFDYWGDHESDKKGNCDKPGCKISKPHGHRNNYQDLKDRIVSNQGRNLLVCKTITHEIFTGQHHHLVVSDEVRHLEALYERFQRYLNESYPQLAIPECFMLTGQTKPASRRKQIVEDIKAAPSAVIFSTVAKEGLDIPAIDRIYLPFPNSNPKVTQQRIGRGTRSLNGKKETVVFDFLDVNVGVLKGQFRSRRFKCYDKLGIEVVS